MSKVIYNNVEWTRLLISNLPNKDVAIDATMGNGHDTLYLATHFNEVIAFDIQEEAIDSTRERLSEHLVNNVKLILDSHSHMSSYVQQANCIIFNLGYLPNANKDIVTEPKTTIEALRRACEIIDVEGLIILTIYQAHDNAKEASAVLAYLETLDSKRYLTHRFQNMNRNLPPFVVSIERLK